MPSAAKLPTLAGKDSDKPCNLSHGCSARCLYNQLYLNLDEVQISLARLPWKQSSAMRLDSVDSRSTLNGFYVWKVSEG